MLAKARVRHAITYRRMTRSRLKWKSFSETQSEVSRLRETNQNLEEDVTKLRVENDQLRRKWMSSVSGSSAAILEASSLRQSNSNDLVTLREVCSNIKSTVMFIWYNFNQEDNVPHRIS